jgi:hypothetical protein
MLLKNILFEAETPEEFIELPKISQALLDRIINEPNPKRQIMLANKNLELLGTGSGRFVYDIGGGKVIKLAPLRPEQNKRELDHWECVKDTAAENMFVRVYGATENCKCLFVEKVVGFRNETTALDLIFDSILKSTDNAYLTKDMLKTYFGCILLDLWNRIMSDRNPPFKSLWYDTLREAISSCGIIVEQFLADNLGYRPSTAEFVILDFGY